ncbi:MAG TPA: efflux RND transporter permease subunit [Burkholderiales bacterium]|nr:efflux RND transporter permease subunit [Burkholderiales bacterium]
MPSRLLDGDSALVTGAARGIGRGIADALEAEGARVFRADVEQADLSNPRDAERLADEAIRKLGSVSIFVHAASPRRQETQTALGATYAEWREMLSVNLDAAFILGQKLGRHMKDQTIKGRILIVEFANQLRDRGLAAREAVAEAATLRLRPILMTTGAMVLGALPLALAAGAGAEARQAIGWVIVGGLLVGTLFTLFVIPTAYLLLVRTRKAPVKVTSAVPAA